MTEHCGDCGCQLCGHGACPECNPCRNCNGGDRDNRHFAPEDYRHDQELDGPGYFIADDEAY